MKNKTKKAYDQDTQHTQFIAKSFTQILFKIDGEEKK